MHNKEHLAQAKEMDSLVPEAMKAGWAFDNAANPRRNAGSDW